MARVERLARRAPRQRRRFGVALAGPVALVGTRARAALLGLVLSRGGFGWEKRALAGWAGPVLSDVDSARAVAACHDDDLAARARGVACLDELRAGAGFERHGREERDEGAWCFATERHADLHGPGGRD